MSPSETTRPRRALMLVNPNARRGDQARSMVDRLEAGGLSVTVEQFASREEMAADILARAADVDLVIVCGGDGTVAAAASALLEGNLPLGILPLGTANDLARTLELPTDLQAAADVILKGRTRRIDVGLVNGLAFFNVASLGLAAEVARRLTPETKRRWGPLGYALTAARCLIGYSPFEARIAMRGEEMRVKTLQVAVGNGRHYGGGQVIQDSARIDDGRLDLYSLPPRSLWKIALLFPAFRRGRHAVWSEVDTARCVEFRVSTETPMPVNADGDLLTHTPAHFEVRPAAVEVFVP